MRNGPIERGKSRYISTRNGPIERGKSRYISTRNGPLERGKSRYISTRNGPLERGKSRYISTRNGPIERGKSRYISTRNGPIERGKSRYISTRNGPIERGKSRYISTRNGPIERGKSRYISTRNGPIERGKSRYISTRNGPIERGKSRYISTRNGPIERGKSIMKRVTFKRLWAIALVICVGGLMLRVWNSALFTGNSCMNCLVRGCVSEIPHPAAAYEFTFGPQMEVHKKSTAARKVLRVEVFPSWTTSDPKDTVFTRRVYLYSAFVALHRAPSTGSYVDIVAFQEGRQLLGLKCCAKIPGQAPSLGGEAVIDFPFPAMSLKHDPASKDLSVFGLVFRCQFPLTATQLGAGHVTLSPTSCPEDERVYLPVGLPEKKPGQLALCGKVAYGHELDPRRLVEWFEMQRLLGVDKILVYDFNNTKTVRKIFGYYRETGLLDPLPYKLPGRKWGRGMAPRHIQFDKDTPPIWDCRLRLAGYDYVMGIDMDEVIMPRKALSLKPLFNEQFEKHGQTAGLFFNVQFFVKEWGPVNPTAPLIFLQYLNSTSPRKEHYKYVYIPSRTHQLHTHTVFSYSGDTWRIFVDPSLATIFHYRKCPRGWKSCNRPRITDNNMLRFQDELVPRVQAAMKRVEL